MHERTVKINFFKNWGGGRLQLFKKLRGPACKFLKNWGGPGPPRPLWTVRLCKLYDFFVFVKFNSSVVY